MEQIKAQLVFVSGYHGTSKKGNVFNMTTFYQVIKDEETGKVRGKEMTFFSDNEFEEWKTCQFGDIVECTLKPSEVLTEPPVLVSIDKVIETSPYVK